MDTLLPCFHLLMGTQESVSACEGGGSLSSSSLESHLDSVLELSSNDLIQSHLGSPFMITMVR